MPDKSGGPWGMVSAPAIDIAGTMKCKTTHAHAVSAIAVGAQALGTLALGSVALGACAVGAIAIGRLVVGRARVRRLEIDELVVRRLHVAERLTLPPESGNGLEAGDSGLSSLRESTHTSA
ncbi:hypothetical protein JIN84_22540 [Luteolibacter yonseiensis]|uniref:Uncharacterized protein n=2 Tax=Luteolibacter yonseiensis TaxID=1144680 RepID=A0A934R7H9_9BACT|nr:hypothetical protein [Luteolibacter yonseiensis]MBK1818414.1 hypothetical protein [Luteolibacter yonseiensis]